MVKPAILLMALALAINLSGCGKPGPSGPAEKLQSQKPGKSVASCALAAAESESSTHIRYEEISGRNAFRISHRFEDSGVSATFWVLTITDIAAKNTEAELLADEPFRSRVLGWLKPCL